jgi:hypothetical protein
MVRRQVSLPGKGAADETKPANSPIDFDAASATLMKDGWFLARFSSGIISSSE